MHLQKTHHTSLHLQGLKSSTEPFFMIADKYIPFELQEI